MMPSGSDRSPRERSCPPTFHQGATVTSRSASVRSSTALAIRSTGSSTRSHSAGGSQRATTNSQLTILRSFSLHQSGYGCALMSPRSSASERPFQSFLSVRYSEVHWPSGWSLRTSPDQIARLQISRESVHRLFQARRLLAQSSQCQVLRPLAPRCYICPRFSWVSSLFLMLRLRSEERRVG